VIVDPLNLALVNATQSLLGIDAEYHAETGIVSSIKVVPDLDAVDFQGGFESVVTEQEKIFLVKLSDAPKITRGELLVFGSDPYIIEKVEILNGEEVRVTLK